MFLIAEASFSILNILQPFLINYCPVSHDHLQLTIHHTIGHHQLLRTIYEPSLAIVDPYILDMWVFLSIGVAPNHPYSSMFIVIDSH